MAKLRQGLTQRQTQRLSPQQIQVVRLLELPTLQLEQRIKRELEENPTLEEGDNGREESLDNDPPQEEMGQESEVPEENDDFSLEDYLPEPSEQLTAYEYSGSSEDDDDFSRKEDYRYPSRQSFREQLVEQIRMRRIPEDQQALAEYIVGNLDSDGYLRRPLQALGDDLFLTHGHQVPEKTLQEALGVVQSLEPAGIGARTLQECLLLQLANKAGESCALARRVLGEYYTEFTKKHYEKICEGLCVDEDALREAIGEIVKLNPKPGDLGSDAHNEAQNAVVPDFFMQTDESTGSITVSLNGRNTPELHVSRHYANMLEGYAANRQKASKQQREAAQFMRKKLDSARWFIESIRQRNETLLSVMGSIAEYQHDFFFTGESKSLRPMILKDIAEMTSLDISTISRVVNSKYVQTPFGILSLRDFFSEGLQTQDGEEVSTHEVKSALLRIIEQEDKYNPLPDDAIKSLLEQQGYAVARRTIAKYREQLKIPVARLRKQL